MNDLAERDWTKLQFEDWFGLGYIAQSPALWNGGFHPETVKIARAAVVGLERLTNANAVMARMLKAIAVALERIPPEHDECHRVARDIRKLLAELEGKP